MEFAYFFNAFGTDVTIVEMLPNVLPVEDTEISVALEKSLTKQGIKIFTSMKLVKAPALAGSGLCHKTSLLIGTSSTTAPRG